MVSWFRNVFSTLGMACLARKMQVFILKRLENGQSHRWYDCSAEVESPLSVGSSSLLPVKSLFETNINRCFVRSQECTCHIVKWFNYQTKWILLKFPLVVSSLDKMQSDRIPNHQAIQLPRRLAHCPCLQHPLLCAATGQDVVDVP